MTKRAPRLTTAELEALHAAAGNIDPCMFDEMDDEREGDRLRAAWESGCAKLADMIEHRRKNKSSG